jgi:type II secretory ATPase GspE/PulE/Tfp pilus assembly ATPase PilB-like protein
LPAEVRRGAGCQGCRGTGYRGRTGVYELLTLGEEIRDAVMRQASASQIRSLAVGKGMRTLKQEGLALVRAGVTTVEEVFRTGG